MGEMVTVPLWLIGLLTFGGALFGGLCGMLGLYFAVLYGGQGKRARPEVRESWTR